MRADARFIKKFSTVEWFDGDGSTVVFALAFAPQENESVEVYINGLLYEEGASKDYQISGVNITFNVTPAVGQRIQVKYWKNKGE